MIVKKIPSSKMAAPKSLAANVRDLADYIAGPRAGGDEEKVEHRGGLNLLALDHDSQVQEMIDLAEVARRDAKPVQHWILSWREGEQPTSAQADEAAKMFLDEMGLAEDAGHQQQRARREELSAQRCERRCARKPRPPCLPCSSPKLRLRYSEARSSCP